MRGAEGGRSYIPPREIFVCTMQIIMQMQRCLPLVACAAITVTARSTIMITFLLPSCDYFVFILHSTYTILVAIVASCCVLMCFY
jgi:hypothetical protein